MSARRAASCASVLFVQLALFPAWSAQVGAQAPMGQGEATIAVRSDVKLGVKGTAGTTSERLARLGQAVGDQMGEIRACYRKQVERSPEVIGAMRVKIALVPDKAAKPLVEITQQEGSTKELVSCVAKVLIAGKYKDVGRPAAALLSLEFDNSRARGEAEMAQRTAQRGQVETLDAPGGGEQASWASDGGQVRFTVRTPPAAPSGALGLVIRGFQSGYAAFLDCRRKCEQGGASPEGRIEAELSIDTKGRAKTKLGEISVAHSRAPGCSDKAFRRVRYEAPATPIQAHVSVYFAP